MRYSQPMKKDLRVPDIVISDQPPKGWGNQDLGSSRTHSRKRRKYHDRPPRTLCIFVFSSIYNCLLCIKVCCVCIFLSYWNVTSSPSKWINNTSIIHFPTVVYVRGFPCGTSGKNLPAISGDIRDTGSISGSGKIPWRYLATHSSLPGESHGQRSLAGYSP